MRPLYCRKCGNRFTNDEALFCEKCGARIEEVEVDTREKAEASSNEKAEVAANEKKPWPTWIIALIVFMALMLLTGAGILAMYFNPNIMPSVNPWYIADEVYQDDEEDEIEENTDGQDDSNSDEDDSDSDENSTGETDVTGSDTDNVTDTTNNSTEDNQQADEQEQSNTKVEPKAYVAGDDTRDNGIHRYEVCFGDVSWYTARDYAESMGENAYLLHINSDEEYEYISNMLMNDYSGYIFWIGAKRDNDNYIYKWVNAEGEYSGDNLVGLKYWLNNEPSFYDVSITSQEDCVDFFYSKTEGRYIMNDVPGNLLDYVHSYSGKMGYIIEIED